jgi:hypothetical protein
VRYGMREAEEEDCDPITLVGIVFDNDFVSQEIALFVTLFYSTWSMFSFQ